MQILFSNKALIEPGKHADPNQHKLSAALRDAFATNCKFTYVEHLPAGSQLSRGFYMTIQSCDRLDPFFLGIFNIPPFMRMY